MPVWRNTDVTFYPDQADALHDQIEDIRKAKNFIFMEYHAVENGRSFAGLKQALKEKAREGVEVRFFYDDVGSIAFVNRDFIREMREAGIACRDFNPVLPILNLCQQPRPPEDHGNRRKSGLHGRLQSGG